MLDGPSVLSSATAAEHHVQIKHKTMLGLRWQTLNTLARQGLTFLTGVVLARLLAPADFGIASLAMVFITWVGILGDVGIGASLIQRKQLSVDDRDAAFWVSGTVGLFSAVCLYLLSPILSRFYHSNQLRPVLYLYSASLFLGSMCVVPAALLRRTLAFNLVSLVEISGTLTSSVTAVFLASRGAGVMCFPIGGALGLITSLLLYCALGTWRVTSLPSRNAILRMGSFTLFASGARIAELVRVMVDNAMVGKFLGTTALGYYALSYNLSAVPEYRVVGLITTVAFPALARLQADAASIRRSYLKMLRYALAIVLPALIGLMLVAGRLIPLVYGPRWLPAVPVLRILCLAGIGCSTAVLTDAPLLALGRADWTFRLNLAWVLLLVVGITFTLRLGYGVTAVAWVVAGAGLLEALLRHTVTARLCNASPRLLVGAAAPAIIAVGAMAAVVLSLQAALQSSASNVLHVSVAIAMGGLTYSCMALWLLPELAAGLAPIFRNLRSRMLAGAA